MPNRTRPFPKNMRIVKPDEKRDEPQRPAIPQEPPPAPDWLDEAASQHWDRIVRQMIQARTWAAQYETTLATYCALLADFQQDSKRFGASRLTQMRLLSADLGLSPSSANRVARTRPD